MSSVAVTARPRSLRVLAGTVALAVWAAVGLTLVVAVLVVAAAPFGLHSMSILSGSMEPTLHVGDLVVGREVRAREVRPGDIVTFRDPEGAQRLLTHRVVRFHLQGSTVYIVTKGDANHAAERWSIPAGGTVGRVVVRIPRLGYVFTHFGGSFGRLLLIALPALLLGFFELRQVWFPREPRRAR